MFTDKAAHDIYQEHPTHLQFVADCAHLWERVQIYDTVVKTEDHEKTVVAGCLLGSLFSLAQAQTPANSDWQIVAQNINPANYYGVTVANGIIGLVSSPEPMKVRDVVLNGAFDTYGRGRVSNILKVFNFANMNLDVDGQRLGPRDIANYRQTLDMQKAALTTTFDYKDKVSVRQTMMALRHLPFSELTMVEITARKDCEIIPMAVIESPENLKEVKNFYTEIDRPHATIRLLTSVAKSPSGRHTVAASTSFIFNEPHGQEPARNPRRLGLQYAPGEVQKTPESR